MKFRDTKGSMKTLLNSPDINCESCESFNSVCKYKMILDGFIWCIHGLTNKPGQLADFKELRNWTLKSYRTEDALNRKPIDEKIVIDSTLFEQLEPQTYRICEHDNVNGKTPKNNLIQVCPVGNVHCDVHCHMGLCLKTVWLAENTRSYKWL